MMRLLETVSRRRIVPLGVLACVVLCVSLVGATPALAQNEHGAAAPDAHAAQPVGEGHTPAAGGHEEGGEHAGGEHKPAGVIPTLYQGLIPMVTSVIVFGIVFFVLSTKVWPKITKGLKEREDKILQEIEAAEEARRQAKDALQSYERSLAEARAEAQKILEETRGQQQKFAAELKAKAEAEVAQMRERAMRDIESAKKTALGEIYAQAAGLATSIAGKILQREVNDSDQQRLVDESLAELGSAN